MRPVAWVVAILVGIGVLIGIVAIVGWDDDSGETVAASEWSSDVCGAVMVWRGQMEAIVEQVRTPSATAAPSAEPQSETKQSRTGFIRTGLERAVQATETMVTAIDNAGIPDTPNGEASADAIQSWAEEAQESLETAQDTLDTEAESFEESISQLTDAARALGSTVTAGIRTVVGLGTSDPTLAAALRDQPTCKELQEARGQ